MTDAIVPVKADEQETLVISAPPPGQMFRARIISKRNAELEATPEFEQRPLPKKQVKALEKERKQLEREIQRHAPELKSYRDDMLALRSVYRQAWDEQKALTAELATIDPDDESYALTMDRRDRARQRVRGSFAKSKALKTQHNELLAMVKRHNQIDIDLGYHWQCVARDKLHEKLRKEMANEAYDFYDILQEELTRLGFCFRYHQKGKERTRRINFSEIHVTTDTVQFKIDSTAKMAFGWKSALPRDVDLTEVTGEKSLKNLTNAAQRQVNGKMTSQNGTWLIVNRQGSTDGVLEYVTLAQVLSAYPTPARGLYPIVFGVKEGRELHTHYLYRHPHILIGGETGGGKSNVSNVILTTLIQMHSPDELRLILLDLKEGAEFRAYETVPHLGAPIISEIDKAAEFLGRLEAYRAERMKRIASLKLVRDIDEYNSQVAPQERMQRVIVMIDEYAAIKGASRDVEEQIQNYILQLSSKGRAAGIHLILSTQMPYVKIIEGPAKGNMSLKLAFRMGSAANSQTIIDSGDAAKLPSDVLGRAIAKIGADRFMVQTPHCRILDIERGLEKASAWDVARLPFELPAPVIAMSFDQAALIDIAMSEFGGLLTARRIWQLVGDERDVSYNQVRELVKLVVARKEIEYEGDKYRFEASDGGAKRMVKI